jgi:hypothetical protein
MTTMRKLVSSLGLIASLTPALAAAQSDKAVVAYLTLIETPPGALAPTLSAPMLGRTMTATDFAIRYGYVALEGASLHTGALTLGIPAGPKATIGLTAGYQGVRCDGGGCDGHFVAGAKVEGRLSSSVLGSGAEAPHLNVGINGEFGFGKPTGGTFLSLAAGLPVTMVSGSPTLRIAPYLIPALGFGRASGGGDSENGTRFLLGGGLMFHNEQNGVGVNLGFQKIFIDQGDTVLGISLSFGLK